MIKRKKIRITDLTQTERTELRIKTLALLRFNKCNMAKTARESRVHEATIRTWLREDDDYARALAAERAEIMVKQREEMRDHLKETHEISALHTAKVVSEQVEKVTQLAMGRVTELANQLVESLMTDLLMNNKTVSFQQRALSFAVLFDKIMVYEGNPTSIHANLGRRLTREQRTERAKQLMETAEERRKKLAVVPSNATKEERTG